MKISSIAKQHYIKGSCVLRTSSAFFLMVLALTIPPSWAATELKDAWQFTAFAGPYGKFKGTTTFDTAMVDNGIFRYNIQGPNFDQFKVFNPENKAYIETTVSSYAAQWAPSIKYPKLVKVGTGKMMGLNAQHYQGEAFRAGLIVDGWFTNDISMNKALSDSFSRICGLPPGYGMPVRVRFKSRSSSDLMFDLLKVSKTRVTTESLQVPKSYHLMKDQALFFLSDEDGSNTGVDEFLRSVPQKKPSK